ncbi:hypothetical protein NM688_g9040 [Phlebia brevispora]|uniref:Uncharacterized protein n=1 Tax=Phlebia brevispora TaxID=194682 RepID=A0ACC1RK06_9APHY|nr:hypothetical protein NM688_g9040 [Phlebia brevispora]
MSGFTILSPLNPSANTCGYCGPPGQRSTEETSYHSAECIPMQLSCQDYQAMIDRGWRRSGTYCYKPDLKRSCCPQYTIKYASLFHDVCPRRVSGNYFIGTFEAALGDEITYIVSPYRFNRWVLHGDDHQGSGTKHKGKDNQPSKLEEAIHASELEHCASTSGPEPAHKFQVTLEPASYTDEKFALYQIYQRDIHKEQEKKPQSFRRFLVENNLHREDIPYATSPPSHLPHHYGAYHQLYRLDGELIAMGVIDILPSCVSSVYFMYNSKWDRFSLGKLSALREASIAREMHAAGAPGMQYLYMGFYIYSCQKMRYKGEYSPSFLADPEDYTWHPLEECKPLLEQYRYACFSHPEHSIEEDYIGEDHNPQLSHNDLKDVNVVISVQDRRAIIAPVEESPEWRRDSVKRAVMTTVDALGPTLAKRVILYFVYGP